MWCWFNSCWYLTVSGDALIAENSICQKRYSALEKFKLKSEPTNKLTTMFQGAFVILVLVYQFDVRRNNDTQHSKLQQQFV